MENLNESKWAVRRSPYDPKDYKLSETQWWKDLMEERAKQEQEYKNKSLFQKIIRIFK